MTTKFNIGEEVWVMLNNEPEKLKVISIHISQLEEYRLYSDNLDENCVKEAGEVFKTKEQLRDYLFGKE